VGVAQVSQGGGGSPKWPKTGRAIYVRSLNFCLPLSLRQYFNKNQQVSEKRLVLCPS